MWLSQMKSSDISMRARPSAKGGSFCCERDLEGVKRLVLRVIDSNVMSLYMFKCMSSRRIAPLCQIQIRQRGSLS
jgi:hypothetical protein